MTEITASLVKTLREKTGAGMMDCKKALAEVNGNLEEAVDWLRKKGLAAAAKKAGRVAAEGLVGVASSSDHRVATVVEINAETDFVSKNEHFQKMVSTIASTITTNDVTLDTVLDAAYPGGESQTIQDEITRLIAVIGENMNLRRFIKLSVTDGVVATYIHGGVAPGLGRIGVAVALESKGDQDKLLEFGKKIAMHIAATQPIALDISDVDPSILEREKSILTEQANASGRPPETIAKMVEGRIRKFYEESVLLEQVFVIDGKAKVKDVITSMEKEVGAPIQLKSFVRYLLGDGIEKQESDFVAEVLAQSKTA